MLTHLGSLDWIGIWRETAIVMAWITVIIFIISGLQDFIYDVGGLVFRLYRRIKFRKRERLTLAKLHEREQQKIAILVPAWHEAEVIGPMLRQVLEKVDYRNYTIFVGTYPNDLETQRAVDALAIDHPQLIKVINSRPGPTSKANCLNNIWKALKEYERDNTINFDIIVLHDAEDTVHPYSLLVFNYLIPRVDAVQLPILPQPTSLFKCVHWTYADEFAENHMKDLMVREKISGFVPFAGVGMGLSRRTVKELEEGNGSPLFNESSLTEDYHMGKRIQDAGMQAIFVNVLLKDDNSPWYYPLCKRPGFVANWSFFPMGFMRAVRQKTRWIMGISLQEWTMTGWEGSLAVKESLFKDRKVFISTLANFLAYIVFLYVFVAELGYRGYVNFQWLLPIIWLGSFLWYLVVIATALMLIRMIERLVLVGIIYGFWAGIFSVPRLVYGNILNGFSSIRAIFIYMRRGKQSDWDKTQHIEGVGQLPSAVAPHKDLFSQTRSVISLPQLRDLISSQDPDEVIQALEHLPREAECDEQEKLVQLMADSMTIHGHNVRACVARVCGYLRWNSLIPMLVDLLYDKEWVVRANAARALTKFSEFPLLIQQYVITRQDKYAWEIMVRVIEQDELAQEQLMAYLMRSDTTELTAFLTEHSRLLVKRINQIPIAK